MSLSKWPPGSHIRFFSFQTLTLVWLWISSPNIRSKLLVCMERSLLVFGNVTFKMAAWWPYWIFQFPDSNLSPNFSSTLLVYMQRSLLIFIDVTFKMAGWWPYWIFLVSGLITLVWLWISSPNFSSKLLVYMERSLSIFSNVTFKMAAWQPYWIF